MNLAQEKRYLKIFCDRFYWLAASTDPREYTLNISGSTSNVYTVSINRRRKTIKCDCPDSKSWARRNRCVCKHCCFVLCKVLRVFPPTIGICDLEFWQTLRFDANDMAIIDQNMERLLTEGSKYGCREMTQRFENLKQPVFEPTSEKLSDLTDEDECPICFDSIITDKASLVICPVCKNLIHQECMEKWLVSGSGKTCVYCRSDIWKKWGKRDNYSKYICLTD